MKNLKQLAATIALCSIASTAGADIVWGWSWGGEAGQIVTDGDLVGGVAPAGTYTRLDASVTQTANGMPIGSLNGGQYADYQPAQGFVWDGTIPTQWFRSSGSLKTGSNLAAVSIDATYFFSPGNYQIYNPDNGNTLDSSSTIAMAPVPEPTSLALLGLGGLLALRRSSAQVARRRG